MKFIFAIFLFATPLYSFALPSVESCAKAIEGAKTTENVLEEWDQSIGALVSCGISTDTLKDSAENGKIKRLLKETSDVYAKTRGSICPVLAPDSIFELKYENYGELVESGFSKNDESALKSASTCAINAAVLIRDILKTIVD